MEVSKMADAFCCYERNKNELGRGGTESKAWNVHISVGLNFVLCLLIALFYTRSLLAETPDEHASHHPEAAGAGVAPEAGPATPGSGGSPAPTGGMPAGGGMMEKMGEMMKGMGAPKAKDFYPMLMELPDLPLAKRLEVEQQARARMHSGVVLMNESLDTLLLATSAQNYASMQTSTASLREGLARFESGLAAQRALAEGKAPRNVALTWFKRDMNLLPLPSDESQKLLGVTPFHLFTMFLLVSFAIAMVGMYFLKMRRAAALFGRIEASKGSPPPGAAPELAGGKPPPGDTPPSGEKLPSGGTPPPGGKPPPVAPKPSPAGAPSASIPVLGGEVPNEATKPSVPQATGGSPVAPAQPPPVSDTTSPPSLTANWRGQLLVGSIVTETPNVKTFRLLPTSHERYLPFTFVPGQFLNLAFWIGGARMNRSYSISSSPTQREYVDLTVRREPRGAVSRHISDLLKVGDKIEAGGPVGKFTFTGDEADSIVLISGGVGITPMMSIARYLTERSWHGDIFFIFACRTPADFIFANEIAVLERRNPKLRVAVAMSRPEGIAWKGYRGRITKEWLMQTVPHLISRRIHLCGPIPMMESTKAILAELGVPPDNLKTESFGTPKPSPAAAGTTAKPTVSATGPLVTFSKNNKSAKIREDLQAGDSPPKQTILELSEELGIGIQFSCRVGTCGVCKVKMTSGEVDQAVQDALDSNDKTNGIVLACQAKPKGAVTVDA